MNTTMNFTKAEAVKQAYYDAKYTKDSHSEGCYALAVDAAHNLGGVEIYNSNDCNSSWSYAPTRTFEFDDSSTAQITYGGVW